MNMKNTCVPGKKIERTILLLRGHKVMLDRDLAVLYNITPGVLKRVVKHNLERFPPDSVFQLTPVENENWTPQAVISNHKKAGIRRLPFAFTENGVAMLSSVLKNRKVARVNIEIARAFTRLREMTRSHKKMQGKIEVMEKEYEPRFRIVFDTPRIFFAPTVKTGCQFRLRE